MKVADYLTIDTGEGNVVYADPPYKNTTKYKENFDHDKFWEWCREESTKTFCIFLNIQHPQILFRYGINNIKQVFITGLHNTKRPSRIFLYFPMGWRTKLIAASINEYQTFQM